MNQSTTAQQTRSITSISIGIRHRHDLGDLDALAANIAEVGLLHPVVITPEGNLIAGRRRLEACRLLGWEEIPVTVLPLDDLLKGEWSENEMRKDFTLKEKIAIGEALEEHVSQQAKERQLAAQNNDSGRALTSSENSPELVGDTRDIIGRAIGMSGTTYEKARQVQSAAAADPETYGPIAEEMLTTGKVWPAYDKTRQLQVKRGEQRTGPTKFRARKTLTATAERRETIRQMAAEGYRAGTIAEKVGVVEGTVRHLLHREHIETVEQRIGKSRRFEVNEIMDAVVLNAVPAEPAIAALKAEWEDLDQAQFARWDAELTSAISTYTRIRNHLRRSA